MESKTTDKARLLCLVKQASHKKDTARLCFCETSKIGRLVETEESGGCRGLGMGEVDFPTEEYKV